MSRKRKDEYRDPETGQYAYWNEWDRLCVCGHKLGIHGAGGFDCLNADRRNIYGPNDPEYHEDNSHCECTKFRPAKKKGRAVLQSSGGK